MNPLPFFGKKNNKKKTRMVVHGQLVEPAVCLSDLYDVFLLDIVRDTRQNLWTMIYRSQWPPNSMRSLTVLDWTSIQSMMHKWINFFGGWVAARISEIFLYKEYGKWILFIKKPNLTKKKFWPLTGEGRRVCGLRKWFFSFFKRIQVWKKKKKKNFLFEGVKVREDWLV